MDEYDQYEGEAEAPAQPDGAFARINGGMLQSGKFINQIVSLVGNITAHDTIRTADGSEVKIATEHLAEAEGSGGLIVDPNKAIEIMGQASGPTEITVSLTVFSMRYLLLFFGLTLAAGLAHTAFAFFVRFIFQAFVCRDLGNDMDMSLYNKLITMQQQDKYAHYFAP